MRRWLQPDPLAAWLGLNVGIYISAYWIGGWRTIGAILLVQIVGSLLLLLVFLHGLSGREDRTKRRIRGRVDDLLANAAVAHHRLVDGCRNERPHGVVSQPDGMTRVYCPDELGEPW